jgi:PAS domain S-box-containing protein
MIWQYSPYFIAFLASGLISLILAATGWQNRSSVCAKPFALLMLSASLWSFGSALEVSSADLPTQMFAVLLQYPGIVTVPVAWLLFAFEYSGREHWITKKNIFLLFTVPAVSIVMVATNNIHHLFYTSVTDQMVGGGLIYPDISYGPFFWFTIIYSSLIIYIAAMLMLQRFVFTSGLYRGQMMAILIAIFTPFFVNLAYAVRQINGVVIDPTPLAFILSGFAIIVGMMRYQLLDITPMAHDQMVANMRDGMIVLDVQGRIISLNAPAERFMDMPLKEAVGITIDTLLSSGMHEPGSPVSADYRTEHLQEMERKIGGRQYFFELRCSPILSGEKEVKGNIIMIRDITDQKNAEIALALARKKINLLSSITRHDILNQVTVLLLNIDTAKNAVNEPELLELLTAQENTAQNIRHQIEFARDYEALGGEAPKWMSIKEIFINLLPVMGTYGITLVSLDHDIEVYADPLLERVFYNLVDNSIQHGEHVTTISVRAEKCEEAITLIFDDNGVGVPKELKQKIFNRGFGKNTGLGLFLAKEILEITGLTITETGVPGRGVRFEIHVPKEQYRIFPG